MKNVICIAAAMLSFSFSASSQNDCSPLRYTLPQFSKGLIELNDGSRQSGVFNICIIDQGVYMLNGQDTVITAANDQVVKVSAGGKLFFKFQDKYIEVIETAGDVLLCLMRSTTIIDNVKAGAYGSVSATASIKSVSIDQAHRVMVDKVLDDPANYRYEESFVLASGNKRYPFTQKNLAKCFPKQKEFVEQYFAEHRVDLKNRGEVLELFLKFK